jgi:hypothetical protein
VVTLLEGVKVLAIENDNLREKRGYVIACKQRNELVTNVIPFVTQLLKVKLGGNCVKQKKINKKRPIKYLKKCEVM